MCKALVCGRGSLARRSGLLRRSPQVAPRDPHERLADGEGGLSHALAPDRAVLREGGPLDEGEREIEAFYSPGSLLHGG